MIKVLVGTDDAGQSKEFLVELMRIGLEPYLASTNEEFESLLVSKDPLVLIYDVDSEDFLGLDGFEKIVEGLKKSVDGHIFLLYSSKSTTEFVRDSLKLGVDGFIPRPLNCEKLEQILNTVVVGNDLVVKNSREFVRVKPDVSDGCSGEVTDLNGVFKFSSSVIDLSFVGVALKVGTGSAEGVDTNVAVTVNLADFGAIVFRPSQVLKRGDVVVFKFRDLLQDQYKVLCSYLYHNLVRTDKLSQTLLNIVK